MDLILPELRLPLREFGVQMKEILERKNVSASELARLMAYKSRNSIFRILDEESGHTARQAFYDRLIEEDPLHLDEAERADLQQALEISRLGQATFLSNRAMRELLVNAEQKARLERMRVCSNEGEDERPVDMRTAQCREIHLYVMGCCRRKVFSALRELLDTRHEDCTVSVTHFIYTGDEEIIRNVSAIQPLLYTEYYKAYCVEPGKFSPEREWLYRTNFIFARIMDKDGKWYNRQLMLVDPDRFMLFNRMESGDEKLLERVLGDDIRQMSPLKKGYFVHGADYPAYTKECLALEQGRAIYTIRLDVPITYVSADILLAALEDDLRTGRLNEWAGMSELIGELERLHRLREDNIFGKRKNTHTIFSKEGMERFARTGRQSDHFFALRPYKPEERVQILARLKEHAENNPYFHVYFFKDEFEAPQMEIGLYEGVGTLLNKPFTDYDLSGNHTETLITQKEFCESYKKYFIQDLLDKWVLSKEETMQVFDELIEIARKSEE